MNNTTVPAESFFNSYCPPFETYFFDFPHDSVYVVYLKSIIVLNCVIAASSLASNFLIIYTIVYLHDCVHRKSLYTIECSYCWLGCFGFWYWTGFTALFLCFEDSWVATQCGHVLSVFNDFPDKCLVSGGHIFVYVHVHNSGPLYGGVFTPQVIIIIQIHLLLMNNYYDSFIELAEVTTTE